MLVLGGTRFVGLHLVRLLHSQGHRVTLLNRGRTQARLPSEVGRIYADRSDPAQMAKALTGRRFDAAFDISGYRPPDLQPVVDVLDGNVGHYVFCSSVAVYAPSDASPVGEDFPLVRGPRAGSYAGNKVLCEDLLLEGFGRRGFPATIIRPPVVYGPHDHIVHRLFGVFARLGQGRGIMVPGDGGTLVHQVHVDDLAAAFAAVPGRSQALGQAYNAAGPEATTPNEYIGTVASIMGIDAQVVHVAVPEYEAMLEELPRFKAAQVFDYVHPTSSRVMSDVKLRGELGWSPGFDMRGGIEMTYRWWLKEGLDRQPWDLSADDGALDWLRSRRGE